MLHIVHRSWEIMINQESWYLWFQAQALRPLQKCASLKSKCITPTDFEYLSYFKGCNSSLIMVLIMVHIILFTITNNKIRVTIFSFSKKQLQLNSLNVLFVINTKLIIHLLMLFMILAMLLRNVMDNLICISKKLIWKLMKEPNSVPMDGSWLVPMDLDESWWIQNGIRWIPMCPNASQCVLLDPGGSK